MSEYTGPDPAGIPPALPYGEAEGAVRDYVSRRFGFRFMDTGLFLEDHWKMIRQLLERFNGFINLNFALCWQWNRMEKDFFSYCGDEDIYDLQEIDSEYSQISHTGHNTATIPLPSSQALQTPYGWLTLLEAAYEHLHDMNGLRRIYAYYIIEDKDGAEEYVSKLRAICEEGDDSGHVKTAKFRDEDGVPEYIAEPVTWPGMVTSILALHRYYHSDPLILKRNKAIERMLVDERLEDEAWRYFQDRTVLPSANDMLDALHDVLVPSHAADVAQIMIKPLRDADGELLRQDTPANRQAIVRAMAEYGKLVGTQDMAREIARLHRMYPSRMGLRHMLRQLGEQGPDADLEGILQDKYMAEEHS